MLLYMPRTESLKVKVQTKRQNCTEKQADPKHTKCSSEQPTTPFQHHIVQTISNGDKNKLESYCQENIAICMISSSHKCIYIYNIYKYTYIYIYNLLPTTVQPTPKRGTCIMRTYFLQKKQSTINYPTNPKQNLFHIILIHLYPIPKNGHQLLRALYGKKTPFFFLVAETFIFHGFLRAHGTNPTNHFIPKIPPKGLGVAPDEAPCRPGARPQKRRPWLARPPRPSAGKTSDDGFQGCCNMWVNIASMEHQGDRMPLFGQFFGYYQLLFWVANWSTMQRMQMLKKRKFIIHTLHQFFVCTLQPKSNVFTTLMK